MGSPFLVGKLFTNNKKFKLVDSVTRFGKNFNLLVIIRGFILYFAIFWA